MVCDPLGQACELVEEIKAAPYVSEYVGRLIEEANTLALIVIAQELRKLNQVLTNTVSNSGLLP